jgi:fatty acid synthase
MNLSDYFVDNEDDIVISGISGRFPESDTIDELRDNLFANKDLVTEDERRWPRGLYGLPTRSGKLKSLDKFDAQFFGLSGKQADHMDPQGRLLLEVTHEAIVDSGLPRKRLILSIVLIFAMILPLIEGYNPGALRGTNTGVFIGASLAETGESLTSDPTKISGQDFIGTKRHMLSNRVSYTFDLRGPSVSVDSSCSSSLVALQLAYSGMRANEFEMAIVGGVSINLNPTSALELQKLNLLSSDGKCKFLDVTADGFVRSETVSAVVLQKRRFARRVYATVIHAKTNSDGHKEQEITQPSTRSQIELMETALTESSVNPEWVRYVEANGNGIPVADESETNAIYKVYGKKR